MFNKRLIAKVLLIHRMKKKANRKPRASYIRPIFLNRNLQGDNILINELRHDELYHFKYFRMDKDNFDLILEEISSMLFHPVNHVRPISPTERLAITLRYLATGNSQISLALNFRISPSSVTAILRETMLAICDALKNYLPKPTEEIWKTNELDFNQKWNFPNSCGAIDGKHIRIKCPRKSGSQFFNYKSYFSIVLLGIVNANYLFTAVDIGSSGSESDGGIFMRSDIGKQLANNTFGLPGPKSLVENGHKIPHVILADSGFPLKPHMMTPYGGDYIPKENRIFNYRLSRGRIVSENAFGILAARFRIFHSPIDAKLDLVKLITRTSVLLHNFLTSRNDFNTISADKIENEVVVPGNWRETTRSDAGMTELQNQGSNNYSNRAAEIRNNFKDYFVGPGKVDWQNKRVTM